MDDGEFYAAAVAKRFIARAEKFDESISNFVYEKLFEYPADD